MQTDLNEKHPEDAYALRGVMRGTSAAVHERDAYELWLAMLPTRTPRGVVLVDPPYEQTDERERITATLAAAHRKWAHGVTVIWYPLKGRATHGWWKDKLRKLGIPKFLVVEHWLYDADQPGIYNGAGLFIVNPPYAFTQELPPLMEALRAALAPLAAAVAMAQPRDDRDRGPHRDRRATEAVVDGAALRREAGRIGEVDRIVASVGIGIPTLWIANPCADVPWIGTHETTLAAGVVPRHGVIELAFAVPVIGGKHLVVGRPCG